MAWNEKLDEEIEKIFEDMADPEKLDELIPAKSSELPNLDEQETKIPKGTFQKKFSSTNKTKRKQSNI